MSELKIGRHINTITGFSTAPSYAKKIGCQIMQIFLGDPQQALSRARPKSELLAFKSDLESNQMLVVIHGAYTINLCRNPNTSRYRTSARTLISDLTSCKMIGPNCLGVIIHMGKNKPEDGISDLKAIGNFISGLKDTLAQSPSTTTIILETGAGVGHEISTKIDVLADIYHGLDLVEKSRIGFCIDTCHIWAAGYDISTKKNSEKFFADFDKLIGVDKIVCIHFNNSKTALGSRVDRHADLAYGQIPGPGLGAVAVFAAIHSIPLIMETPLDAVDPKTNQDIGYADELAVINKWLRNTNQKKN